MKKLFKAIRHDDLDEVKAIIEKNPKSINCVATPPPKKDNGQSPLQVALKTGATEIANYLIDNGADINFMEAEDDDPGVRAPVLHDAIRAVLMSLCHKSFDISDEGLDIVEKLLKKGADPNKTASNGYDSLNRAVSDAEYILDHSYPSDISEKAEQQLIKLLDLLIEHGADFHSWANRGHYPEPTPMESNKVRYLDDFVASEDVIDVITIRGKRYESVIKGDIDRTARTRDVMQRYCKDRNILI